MQINTLHLLPTTVIPVQELLQQLGLTGRAINTDVQWLEVATDRGIFYLPSAPIASRVSYRELHQQAFGKLVSYLDLEYMVMEVDLELVREVQRQRGSLALDHSYVAPVGRECWVKDPTRKANSYASTLNLDSLETTRQFTGQKSIELGWYPMLVSSGITVMPHAPEVAANVPTLPEPVYTYSLEWTHCDGGVTRWSGSKETILRTLEQLKKNTDTCRTVQLTRTLKGPTVAFNKDLTIDDLL